MASANEAAKGSEGKQAVNAPAISLPKGGGAIRSIGESFAANLMTDTSLMTVLIATSPTALYVDNLSTVTTADLLSNGIACLARPPCLPRKGKEYE